MRCLLREPKPHGPCGPWIEIRLNQRVPAEAGTPSIAVGFAGPSEQPTGWGERLSTLCQLCRLTPEQIRCSPVGARRLLASVWLQPTTPTSPTSIAETGDKSPWATRLPWYQSRSLVGSSRPKPLPVSRPYNPWALVGPCSSGWLLILLSFVSGKQFSQTY